MIFLFILYFIVLCFLLMRSKFLRTSGLRDREILVLFTIKIIAGLVLGLINDHLYKNTTDYDLFNKLGGLEYENLIHHPKLFFTDSAPSTYKHLGEFFSTDHSFWNDLRTNLIIKFIGLIDVVTWKNYYLNSLIFNFFIFFGHVALYRTFINIFPSKKLAVMAGCFLIPTTLAYTSGIHRDPLIFAAFSFLCYATFFSMIKKFTVRRCIITIISFLLILALRNFIAVLLLPFLLTWIIVQQKKINPRYAFGALLIVLAGSAVFLHYAAPGHDPFSMVAQKQKEFLSLGSAKSDFKIDTLSADPLSFLHAFPAAASHAFASPYPGQFKNIFLNLLSPEMLFFIVVTIAYLVKKRKPALLSQQTLCVFSMVFACVVLIFAGLITPNAGALVRYKSIWLPFLFLPMMAVIEIKFKYNKY